MDVEDAESEIHISLKCDGKDGQGGKWRWLVEVRYAALAGEEPSLERALDQAERTALMLRRHQGW